MLVCVWEINSLVIRGNSNRKEMNRRCGCGINCNVRAFCDDSVG